MSGTLIMDIETWPMDSKEIEPFLPKPTQFDPATVKLGNTKNPDLQAAKIAAAEVSHVEHEAQARATAIARTTLRAATSRIFAIVTKSGDSASNVMCKPNPTDDDERLLVDTVWNEMWHCNRLVGHNILNFDLPFLVFRTLALGMSCPIEAWNLPKWQGGRVTMIDGAESPNCVSIIDTMQAFDRFPADSKSLDHAAQCFRIPGKTDLSGKLAWQVCLEDEELCREYTKQDGDLTYEIACKMGVPMI